MTADPAREARTRGRPPAASRAQVVAVALRLLDESGLDALTMRKLGTAVGVQVGTLYGYFPTKRALLTAMAEAMLGVCSVVPEGPPRERVLALVRAFRVALLTHRDGGRVYAGTHATGPNTLGLADALVGALREAGFEAVAAVEKTLLLLHFTTGHVLEEQAATGAESELPGEIDDLRRAIGGGVYSHLSEVGEYFTAMNYADLFERGIQLMTTDLR